MSGAADMLTLRAGRLSLELSPALGGSVSSFRLAAPSGPFDLMRPMTVPAGAAPHALHSGMFPMLPFANCIRDNAFTFDDRPFAVGPNMVGVRLNYHGSGWQLPWQVATAGPDRAELVLDDVVVDAAYRYAAAQRFRLTADALHVETEVTNRADIPMPFSFGQHPWFLQHGGAEVSFAATGLWFEDSAGHAERLVPITTDRDYSHGRRPPPSYQNNCYAGWSGTAAIAWKQRDIGLTIEAGPEFGHLMFHVPAHSPRVFCLEPQSNAPCAFDGLEQGLVAPGVHILRPGQSVRGTLRFVVSSGVRD